MKFWRRRPPPIGPLYVGRYLVVAQEYHKKYMPEGVARYITTQFLLYRRLLRARSFAITFLSSVPSKHGSLSA